MPDSLATTTYQAHVLGKGSTHPEKLQGQASQGGLATSSSSSLAGAAAAAADAHGCDDASGSGRPLVRSPFKDALSRLPRLSRTPRSPDASGGGEQQQQQQQQQQQRQSSGRFLQRALRSMQQERRTSSFKATQYASSAAALAVAPAAAVGAAQQHHHQQQQQAGCGPAINGAGGLHTVVEVRHPSTGTGAAGGDAGSNAAGSARRVSAELRATHPVKHNTVLRKQLICGSLPPYEADAAEAAATAEAGSSSSAAGTGAPAPHALTGPPSAAPGGAGGGHGSFSSADGEDDEGGDGGFVSLSRRSLLGGRSQRHGQPGSGAL
jgi:hypothetical protein